MKVAFVTNIPAPYRIETLNKVAATLGDDLIVFFCSQTEPNRKWDVPEMRFRHIFLKERFKSKSDGTTFVHNNPDIWKELKIFNPDVVITGGFNPTMLYAFLYCQLFRKKHIPISDAWAMSEQHLSFAHRAIRKIIYRFSKAYIACSQKGKAYYESYHLPPQSIFLSHYTITNQLFSNNNGFEDRPYDLLFSGQFTARKNPFFFVEVAQKLKAVKPEINLLLLGDGPLREQVLASLRSSGIRFTYPGYASQKELPAYYGSCKLFLFPTAYDAWGVVANEALAAATPICTTEAAGCAGELVLNDQNGYVLPLDAERWAKELARLLTDKMHWAAFSQNAGETARKFTHEKASAGILAACQYAYPKYKGTAS